MAKKLAKDCGPILIHIVLAFEHLLFQNATFTFFHAKEDSFYEADDVFQF